MKTNTNTQNTATHTNTRRRLLQRAAACTVATAVIGLIGAVALPQQAIAQPYPSKPVRIINPFSAGGGLDQLARILAQRLGEATGQSFIVENRTGASGNIGADAVAKSAPDGYTLVMASSATHGINPALFGARLPFDPIKDFATVSVSVVQKNVLVVNAATPANNVRELVALAKAQPGKLSFGSAGAGTSQGMSGELFKSMAGVNMTHVPYKGSAAAMTDLLGGQITMMFTDIPTAIPHIRSGKLKALGLTAAQISPALPDVQPIDQQGLKGFDLKAWYGLMAPAGTPRAVAERLNGEINKALATPELRERLLAMGMEPLSLNLAEADAYVKTEIARWAEVVKISGAKID